ncbi:MAG: hypothetical protein JWM99_990 [Verrucomicrobiales bacterium]|nr:hypothetical protein [Verrucomicrobiales bacterium]
MQNPNELALFRFGAKPAFFSILIANRLQLGKGLRMYNGPMIGPWQAPWLVSFVPYFTCFAVAATLSLLVWVIWSDLRARGRTRLKSSERPMEFRTEK